MNSNALDVCMGDESKSESSTIDKWFKEIMDFEGDNNIELWTGNGVINVPVDFIISDEEINMTNEEVLEILEICCEKYTEIHGNGDELFVKLIIFIINSIWRRYEDETKILYVVEKLTNNDIIKVRKFLDHMKENPYEHLKCAIIKLCVRLGDKEKIKLLPDIYADFGTNCDNIEHYKSCDCKGDSIFRIGVCKETCSSKLSIDCDCMCKKGLEYFIESLKNGYIDISTISNKFDDLYDPDDIYSSVSECYSKRLLFDHILKQGAKYEKLLEEHEKLKLKALELEELAYKPGGSGYLMAKDSFYENT